MSSNSLDRETLQALVDDWMIDAKSTRKTSPAYALARDQSAKELSRVLAAAPVAEIPASERLERFVVSAQKFDEWVKTGAAERGPGIDRPHFVTGLSIAGTREENWLAPALEEARETAANIATPAEVAALKAEITRLQSALAQVTQEREMWKQRWNEEEGGTERHILACLSGSLGQDIGLASAVEYERRIREGIRELVAAKLQSAESRTWDAAEQVVQQAEAVDKGNRDWDAACDYILTQLRAARTPTPTDTP